MEGSNCLTTLFSADTPSSKLTIRHEHDDDGNEDALCVTPADTNERRQCCCTVPNPKGVTSVLSIVATDKKMKLQRYVQHIQLLRATKMAGLKSEAQLNS